MQTVSRRCFLSAFRQCVATIYTSVKDFEVFIPESATWISKVDLRQDFAAGRVDVYVTLTDNLDSDYERNSSIRISSETNEKIFCDVDIRQSPYDGYVEISDFFFGGGSCRILQSSSKSISVMLDTYESPI